MSQLIKFDLDGLDWLRTHLPYLLVLDEMDCMNSMNLINSINFVHVGGWVAVGPGGT